MASITMSYVTPRTDQEWEQWRETFTQLYHRENFPLPKVMKIMEDDHGVKAR